MAIRSARFTARRRSEMVLIALALVGVCGCSRPLLSPEDERSPYDRYDALRNQYAQQYIEDEYGRQKPNLRARLSPKE